MLSLDSYIADIFLFLRLIVTPIVGVCNCSMLCCTLLYVHSSIAFILMGKRELIALLNLSSWCLMMVEQLFLAVPQGCLQFVIVVFPDHTHLLFSKQFPTDWSIYLLSMSMSTFHFPFYITYIIIKLRWILWSYGNNFIRNC